MAMRPDYDQEGNTLSFESHRHSNGKHDADRESVNARRKVESLLDIMRQPNVTYKPFGSLLELAEKLRQTDKRHKKIFHLLLDARRASATHCMEPPIRQTGLAEDRAVDMSCKSPLHFPSFLHDLRPRSISGCYSLTVPSSVPLDTYLPNFDSRNNGCERRDARHPPFPTNLVFNAAGNYGGVGFTGLGNEGRQVPVPQCYPLPTSIRDVNSDVEPQTLHGTASPAESADEDGTEDAILTEQRRFRCHMCSYQTDNRSHLRRHQSTVHKTCKLYRCYICHMDFSRSERAKSHFLSIHPEIPYHSKLVRKHGIDTINQAALTARGTDDQSTGKPDGGMKLARKSWEKYCHLVPPSGTAGCHFRCVKCPHVGPDIWHLKRHYLDVHSGAKSYACRVCRYSTGDVNRLVSHMTGHGELFCHSCSFSTVEMDRFKAHLTTCDGRDEAQCPVCGDNFVDRLTVKNHVTVVHGRDFCEQCACVIYAPETIADHQHQSSEFGDQEDAKASANPAYWTVVQTRDCSSNFGSDSVRMDIDQNCSGDATQVDDSAQQPRYRFGRFSNQTYYCNAEGCSFKATWKKSVELHMLNYHNDSGNMEEPAEAVCGKPASPDVSVGGVLSAAGCGLFNCPFCPNSRTFKYRKSYEKHLLQHGVDYTKHPYLIVRSSMYDSNASALSSALA